MENDLELKELGQYTGTEKYLNIMGINVTDGIGYIMENGYSWFVTDCIAVIKTKLNKKGFLSIKLKLNKDKVDMIITDGNEKILYKQHYEYTDAKKELMLFYTDGVLMLDKEY